MDTVGRNSLGVTALRRIMFAVHHLPKDVPHYWKTIKEFAGSDGTLSQVQTAVENMEYLHKEAFATDEELLQTICKESVGIVLISPQKTCRSCGADLVTRSDRLRKLVLYTESSGTLPAVHFRKRCSKSNCNLVQHYGYHSLGEFRPY